MYDLTLIKKEGGYYADSREVAEAIEKPHNDLMKSIRKYYEYFNAGKISPVDFFVSSTYLDTKGETRPCYLLSKMGCEVVAHKLTGEKGVLFTAAYVKKFNLMEAAEREAEIKSHAKPRLGEFNSAVRNVLNGMSQCFVKPKSVMKFLRGVYSPLGIEVEDIDDYFGYHTVTEIAAELGVYSASGRPHGHAVSAIISKLEKPAHHAVVIPYGLVGVTMRYDRHIVEGVWNWLMDNEFPSEVPYQGFDYHIYYNRQTSLLDDDFDDDDFDGSFADDFDDDFFLDDDDEIGQSFDITIGITLGKRAAAKVQ